MSHQALPKDKKRDVPKGPSQSKGGNCPDDQRQTRMTGCSKENVKSDDKPPEDEEIQNPYRPNIEWQAYGEGQYHDLFQNGLFDPHVTLSLFLSALSTWL